MVSEQEIIIDLSAPIRSFRLFALEQSINSGSSAELLKALEEHRRVETDEECLNLMPYAIDAVRARITGEKPFDATSLTTREFLELYSTAAPSMRLRLLLSLPRKLVPELVSWAVEEFPKESASIQAQILAIFGLSWPIDKLDLLIEMIFGGPTNVRVAALDAIISVAPFRLTGHFPSLLLESDPRIMATTIKGLAKIDEEEAKKYIENELLGKSQSRKLAILRVATFLRFNLVKGPLLKFLSVESEQSLLEKAGLIFHINPDLEALYRLWEMMNNADSKKLPILKETFEGAWGIIKNSGILGNNFSGFLQKLEQSSKQQEMLKSVHIAVNNLESEDEIDREEGKAALTQKQQEPFFKEAVKKVSAFPLTQTQRQKVEEILAEPKTPERQDLFSREKPGDFFALQTADQCRWLARLGKNDQEKGKKVISFVLNDNKTDSKVKAVALRSGLRLEIDDFRQLAERWIYRQEELLVVAALEYLARFDLEKLNPRLGMFHKSRNPRIRIAAMKILWFQDPAQAMSSILAILKSPEPRTRSTALSTLMGFDFSLIRESIVEFLETARDAEILDPILWLFQNNPAPENLFCLYRLEKAFPEVDPQKILLVRVENSTLIENLNLLSPDELKKLADSFPEKWNDLKARKAAPPPYSFDLVNQVQIRLRGTRSFFAESVNQVAMLVLIGMLVFSGVWVAVGAMLGPENLKKIESGGLLSDPIQIEGKVINLANDGKDVLIIASDSTLFQVLIPKGNWKFNSEEKVKAILKPFRKSNGVIFARFVSMEK